MTELEQIAYIVNRKNDICVKLYNNFEQKVKNPDIKQQIYLLVLDSNMPMTRKYFRLDLYDELNKYISTTMYWRDITDKRTEWQHKKYMIDYKDELPMINNTDDYQMAPFDWVNTQFIDQCLLTFHHKSNLKLKNIKSIGMVNIFKLYYYEGFNFTQISDKYDISYSTVYEYVSYVKEHVKKCIENELSRRNS